VVRPDGGRVLLREDRVNAPDRTGQVWERCAGDELDATWVVVGPPRKHEDARAHDHDEWHLCLTLIGSGEISLRCEPSVPQGSWEDGPYLKRLF